MSWDNQANIGTEEQEKKKEQKMEFKKLKDAKQSRGIKILSYGNFSTGKTHFALTGNAPVYVIDTENGVSPLADKFPEVNVMNICDMSGGDLDEKDEVKNFENFQEAINYLVSLPDEQVGTVVIDSISDIWSWAQAYAKTKVFKIPIEDRFKQQFDWAVPSSMLRKNIQKLINKNCDVIFTAREDEIYEGAGKPAGRYKANVQKKVPYMVDVVLYMIKRYVEMKSKKDKRNSGRKEGRLLGKNSIDIEEGIEPTIYWDEWSFHKDGLRFNKDRTHLFKGKKNLTKEQVEKINKKIKKKIRITKLKRKLKGG